MVKVVTVVIGVIALAGGASAGYYLFPTQFNLSPLQIEATRAEKIVQNKSTRGLVGGKIVTVDTAAHTLTVQSPSLYSPTKTQLYTISFDEKTMFQNKDNKSVPLDTQGIGQLNGVVGQSMVVTMGASEGKGFKATMIRPRKF